MDEFVFVYMTTSSLDQARVIGRRLVEARLAACANILPGMESIYHWQGKIETAQETVLIAKTRAVLVDQLTAMVKQLHSYDCPCVVALPITAGIRPICAGWGRKRAVLRARHLPDSHGEPASLAFAA